MTSEIRGSLAGGFRGLSWEWMGSGGRNAPVSLFGEMDLF